jgi:hypothetical protein
MVDPGYTTTEFWITLLTNMVSTVFLFHPTAIAGQTATSANAAIPQIAAILVMIATTVSYIISRTNVKTAASATPASVATPPAK